MNQRERMLAITVAALVVGACLYYGGKRVHRVFAERNQQIEKLNEELELKQLQCARGMQAKRLLDTYESRALPGEMEFASSRYRAWLLDWVESVGIYGTDVKCNKKTPALVNKEPVHDVLDFTVVCDGTLPQLVELLYGFYSQDYLHRIKVLSVTPTKGQVLQLKFTLEAIAMPGVADRPLKDLPSQRLALESLADYSDVIVQRNPYAPANKPPRFASTRTQEGYVNERMSFAPEAADPEEGRLTYRVEHDGLDGLRIDPRSGRIEWTPQEVGEYEVLVYAADDGIPAKEAVQTVRLAVSEPPPPEPEDDPPPTRPSFDEAKYTFVTGIVEVNGRRQVWLTVRTEGKWLRLFEGEEFRVGNMEGKVIRIHPRTVEIATGDAVLGIRFGQSLYDGEVLRDAADVAARDR